jgi:hypothetical protein
MSSNSLSVGSPQLTVFFGEIDDACTSFLMCKMVVRRRISKHLSSILPQCNVHTPLATCSNTRARTVLSWHTRLNIWQQLCSVLNNSIILRAWTSVLRSVRPCRWDWVSDLNLCCTENNSD